MKIMLIILALVVVFIVVILLLLPVRPTTETAVLNQQMEERDQTEEVESTINVRIQNYEYNPSSINIKKGDTVTWTNLDTVQHDISGNTFKSSLLRNGESFSYTFNTEGTYEYVCTPHPYMKGTVIVQ